MALIGIWHLLVSDINREAEPKLHALNAVILSRLSGKAGCGKSTLMKHLYGPTKRKPSYASGLRSNLLITGCFFFWYLGTPQQKSYNGLTQTLLYHTLQSDPTLMPRILPNMWLEAWESDGKPSLPSLGEINAAFQLLSELPGDSRKLCFFIDGLDEYSGDYHDGIAFTERLSEGRNIKVFSFQQAGAGFHRSVFATAASQDARPDPR